MDLLNCLGIVQRNKIGFQQPLATICDEFILIIPWVVYPCWMKNNFQLVLVVKNLPPSPKFVHHIKPASFPHFDRFSQPIIDCHPHPHHPHPPSQVNALRQDFLTTNPAPAKLSRAEKAARNVSAAGKKAREITQALEDAIKAEDEAVPRMGWWWNDGIWWSLKKSL